MKQTWRPVAVWLGVSAAAGVAAAATPGAWVAASTAVGTERVDDLLVAGCTAALAAALGWLWILTTSTVWGVLRGSAPRHTGATRRLVLLACGAAVATGAALPAQAAGGDGAERLAGLPLPERAVSTQVHQVRAPGDHYVVRAGDSLWSIARARPGVGSVDERWRAIWAANRDVVGDDPDLIHPGLALELPGTTTDETDGDR